MRPTTASARAWARPLKAAMLAASLIACCVAPAAAAPFPKDQRPIRFVVPAPAGGALDAIARLIADEVGRSLKHAAIVENRPGGRSALGAHAVSGAEPDGHTLLVTSTSLTMMQALFGEKLFDLSRQFAPVSLIATGPLLLVARRDLPVASIADLVALAKKRPGVLKYGSGGVGTSMHMTTVLFERSFGLDLLHVPFQGGGPSLNALLGSHIDVMFDPVVTLLPQVESGTVRPLGVTSRDRYPQLPSVPTIAESGVTGFEVAGWFGLLAPAATPPDVMAALNRQVVDALGHDHVKARLRSLGVEGVGSTPASFGDYQRGELERWKRVVAESNLKAE